MPDSQRTNQKLVIPTVSATRINSRLTCRSQHKVKVDSYRLLLLSVLSAKPTGSTLIFQEQL